MIFPTDILRAALHCVASENEPREYLQGVYITPTHIKATDGRAAVMMEHGAETEIDAVFIVYGNIPNTAEGTLIRRLNDGWMAFHFDEDDQHVGSNELVEMKCRYPDFSKLLPTESEPCDELPIFSSHLLALPYLMFGEVLGFTPVKFKPYGKTAACQLIFDSGVNSLFGNPLMVIMPVREGVFEMMEDLLE
ncbi:hypothetical protein MF265_06535 [Serratia marcescens]|uniref:hypothetical protein n=1 Tax=Serratia marcescens TaxID=615 RepID=UPI001EEFB84A|nr:hypothetical protein [Serratia marcescens]ULH12416.1 hypothetical protein MF265_06535 [Serratia marcescens]